MAVLQYPLHTRLVISTFGMLSTRCVHPASWAPPPRAVGSRGRWLPRVMTVGPFLRRLSAIRLPIMPHISSHFWSGRMNFAPLACDSRREKSIGTMGRCMSFEAFESKNSINFVPRTRFGMPEGVDLLMLYSISVLFVDVLNYWLLIFYREIGVERNLPIWTMDSLDSCISGDDNFPFSYISI